MATFHPGTVQRWYLPFLYLYQQSTHHLPLANVTYTIFLASSAELSDDRIDFGDIVQELNDRYAVPGRNVRFKLYKWERDLASFAERRKQEEYNHNIETCRIFVMLYASKVGMYTEEEYDFAYNRFKKSGAPQVLVFKKSGIITVDDSISQFEQKIKDRDQQFQSYYKDTQELRTAVFHEIIKYFDNKILQYGVPARTLFNDGQSVPANFTGREDELKTIKEKLGKGDLMLINAEGGIGKTTLAAKYWKESENDYEYNTWFFCENGIVSELKKLAPGLKLDLSNMNEEEQITALKAALQNISHDFLLVLDNANKEEDIRAFKQAFRGFPWHVLITSRCNGILEKEQEYQITHLPPEKAKELFTSNYKEDGPEFDALLDQFLAAIQYHTLLIDIFSKNMVEWRKRRISFAQFLAQLEGNGLFLEKGSFKVVTGYTDSRHKTAATTNDILNILYDFTELSETERYWLVNMALLPAVSHDFVFLCELFRQDKMEFLTLDELARKGWLAGDETGYRISPVIQGITLEKNKITLQRDAKALIDNLNAKLKNNGIYLKHFNGAGPYAALTESITGHLISEPFYALSLLNFNASTYYTSIGDLVTAQDCAEKFKSISEKREDKSNLAMSYEKLGGINERLGRLTEALQFYEDCKRLEEELHRDYPDNVSFKGNLAVSYGKLGGINEKLGRLMEALQFYEDDIKLIKELHRDYPSYAYVKNDLAITYERLGGINEKLGRLTEALQFYEDQRVLFEELHRDSPSEVYFKNNLAISYRNLGGINEKLGRLTEALQFYQDVTVLFEELRHDYPGDIFFKHNLAISYEKLGGINETMGRLTEALQFYKDYKRLEEELHRDYPGDVSFKNNLAVSYAKLAGIFLKQSAKQKAIPLFEQAERLWQELAEQFPDYAEFTNNLAVVQQQLITVKE